MDKLLELAIKIAVRAHKGSVDKQNKIYILHPIRVMVSVETVEEKIVAILHDVVEDTDITFEDLVTYGFPLTIIDALKYLTRDKSIKYFDYIEKIKENDLARKVKLADLKDNMRDGCPSSLLERYKKAYIILTYEDVPQKTCINYNGHCKLGIKGSCKSCKENNWGYTN